MIGWLNVDEAHFIVTAGEPDEKGVIFRPEYSKIFEVIMRLPEGTACALYSATLARQTLSKVLTSLRIPAHDSLKTSLFMLSINRPNLTFAVDKIDETNTEIKKLAFLIPKPFKPLPKIVIFVDSVNDAIEIEKYLLSILPEKERKARAVRRLYASMSVRYKVNTMEEFSKPDGVVRILVTTSATSNVRSTFLCFAAPLTFK